MIMTPRIRRIALTLHITISVSVLGAVTVFLVLAIAGLNSQNAHLVRAVYLAMDLTARYVVVPLASASLLTGLIQSLGTDWGLFRHWWVLAKLFLTVLVTIVLLLQLEVIGYLADAAMAPAQLDTALNGLRLSLVVHAAGGLLVLLLPVALSVFKPRGTTAYGWRKQQEQH